MQNMRASHGTVRTTPCSPSGRRWMRRMEVERVKLICISSLRYEGIMEVQGSAKRRGLGCVNSLPGSAWLQLTKQPCLFAYLCTGSSKINGAKFSDACSVRANWLCMGWPFCLAEMRREFQTGGKKFCTTLYWALASG